MTKNNFVAEVTFKVPKLPAALKSNNFLVSSMMQTGS